MARRRMYWHIGLDDLGTAFVAHALDERRAELAAHGVQAAGTPAAWELATAEVLRSHRLQGFRRAEVEGQVARLADVVWRHKGTSVLSTPGLAVADRDQVRLALDGLRGVEVHLVVVVRDRTEQAYAAAQAALETGTTTRPEKFVARVLDDTSEHEQAVTFRAGHDVADVVRRWGRTVLPEHVHLIEATAPQDVWAALTGLLRADDVTAPDDPPAQLDRRRLAVLRETALGLDERIDARGRRLALRDRVSRDLLPGAAAGEDPLAAALAGAVVEVARLQQENAELIAENLRLDRKRRKHKRRVKELQGRDVQGGAGAA